MRARRSRCYRDLRSTSRPEHAAYSRLSRYCGVNRRTAADAASSTGHLVTGFLYGIEDTLRDMMRRDCRQASYTHLTIVCREGALTAQGACTVASGLHTSALHRCIINCVAAAKESAMLRWTALSLLPPVEWSGCRRKRNSIITTRR